MVPMRAKRWILVFGAAALLGVSAACDTPPPNPRTGLPSGSEVTSVQVQNVGSSAATIAMDYYAAGGGNATSADVRANVPPIGTAWFSQSVPGLPSGFRGLGQLSSDQPVRAVRVMEVNDAARSSGNFSYTVTEVPPEGGHRVALPLLYHELASARWNARIQVANTGTQVACLRLTYYRVPGVWGAVPPGPEPDPIVHTGPGGGGCTTGFPLAPGAQLFFGPAPGDPTAYPPNTYITYPAQTYNNQMAGLIEVLNPTPQNKVVAVVDLYRADGLRTTASYSGFVDGGPSSTTDDIGTEVYVPIALKTTDGTYTHLTIMNLDGTPANVTLEYNGRVLNGFGDIQQRTVTLQNVRFTASHNTYYQGPNVDVGFLGSVKVRSTARLAVVVTRAKLVAPGSLLTDSTLGAARGIPVDRAATTWYVPLMYRNLQPGNLWSRIHLHVADGGSANVQLTFVGDPTSGCPVGPYTSVNYAVSGARIFDPRLNDVLGNPSPPPACFRGGARLTADRPVFIIVEMGAAAYSSSSNDAEALYNAFQN